MSSDTLTKPEDTITTDRPDKAHIVPRRTLTDAIINGTEVTALCGFRWVPSRDPEGLPGCAECKAEAARMGISAPKS